MLLSNQKIDYSSVRRIQPVKLTGQTQGTSTTTTTNTMPTSTSLQDINSHAQKKFTWNNNNDNNKDPRFVSFPETLLSSSNPTRQLTTSQSDERIFEHPEVTIKPSALDDELQRRLLTMKTSNTNDNLVDRDVGQSAPNILEHPDMRAPVFMQTQQISSSNSSSALFIQNNCQRVCRTQSAEVYTTTARTPLPGNHHVEFFIDNQLNSKLSTSPGSRIGDIIESPEQEKNEDLQTIATESIREYSKPSSKSDDNLLKTKTNDSW